MKLTFLFLVVGLMQLSASVYSQSTKLSLEMRNAKVAEVLDAIESQSEFRFAYSPGYIDLNRKVTIDILDKTIDESLNVIFAGTNVEFGVFDRHILLYPESLSPVTENLVSHATGAQQRTVSGTVTDETGLPLPGVTVLVKGTTQGTVTNADGNYSLTNTPEDATLAFSFVGMRTQEVVVGNQTTINVTMDVDAIGIEEVVAVGYGSQKKINITGSVSTVSGEELSDRPISSVAHGLQGLVPNLQISTTDGGRPGSSMSMQIRGVGTIGGADNDPLIIIDGVPGSINNINPDDVESISVLKDAASSAIYGSRAPYGVILITTKQGKPGEMKVTFDTNVSWRGPIKRLQPLGTLEFMDLMNEGHENLGISPFFDELYYEQVRYKMENPDSPDWLVHSNDPERWDRGVAIDFNWYDWTYKKNALTQDYNVGASGGTERVTYYISLGYLNEDGLYRQAVNTDFFERYTGLINLHAKATEWLDIGYKLQLSRRNTSRPNTNQLDRNAFRSMPNRHPIAPNGHWRDGTSRIAHEGGRRNSLNDAFNNTLYFDAKLFEGFKLHGDLTFNSNYGTNVANTKQLESYSVSGKVTGASTSDVSKSFSTNKFYTTNFYADYSNNINNHNFYALAGFQQEYSHFHRLNGYRDQLITDDLLSLSIATGDNMQVNDFETEWATQGYFGRVTYNYQEKYLLEFNGRYDGTSRFPYDYRWGFFPSASAGYIISRESYFEPLTTIVDVLKLRLSYGRLGNSNVGNYYSASMSKGVTDYVGPDGTFLDYMGAPGFGNYHLTWEKPTTFNVGIDAGFFRNRLELNFDWFQRRTIDMIGPSNPLPAVLGASVPNTNNTELLGKGWELTMLNKGSVGDFRYQIKANVSRSREVVENYFNPEGNIREGNRTFYYPGMVLGEIWGFETVGFINDEETLNTMPDQSDLFRQWGLGDIQYKDQLTEDTDGDGIPDAGDGKITYGSRTLDDPGDLVVIGNRNPDYTFSLILSANYKNFDFQAFFRGNIGGEWWPQFSEGDLGNSSPTEYMFFGNSNNDWNHGLVKEHLDRWTPDNKDAYYPRTLIGPGNRSHRNRKPQTRYLQDMSFLRLKNFQFGYTIPSKLMRIDFIQNARIYVSGENLLTLFDNVRIYDVETPGLIYPLNKSMSVGLKLSF